MAECEAYDPRPRFSGGRTRFKCPRHGGDHQKSLSVDPSSGEFTCHNASCGIWGTLREFWRGGRGAELQRPLRAAEPLLPNEVAVVRSVEAWRAYQGSPAQAYARARGVPDDLARSLGLGYWRGRWDEVESEWLTFPMRCPVTGRPVSVAGRNIHSDDRAVKSRKMGAAGLFGAAGPGPMPSDVIAVEGAFDALALMVLCQQPIPDVRALMGAYALPEWFDRCERVTLLLDDDTEGQRAAVRLRDGLKDRRRRRGCGPRVFFMEPGALLAEYGCKDLGEVLQCGEPIFLSLPPLTLETGPATAGLGRDWG